MTPSAGRTRNALAIATPSKKVCSSSPTRAEGPARRFTACVSSPKWKCGVSVCCVRCTARYPASTSAGAAVPERANASGSTSTSATASMTGRQQCQQVIRVLTCLGEPPTDGRHVFGVGILVAPLADHPRAFDVLGGAPEPGHQRGRIPSQERGEQHRITRELVQGLQLPAPRSLLPQLRQPYPRRPDVHP